VSGNFHNPHTHTTSLDRGHPLHPLLLRVHVCGRLPHLTPLVSCTLLQVRWQAPTRGAICAGNCRPLRVTRSVGVQCTLSFSLARTTSGKASHSRAQIVQPCVLVASRCRLSASLDTRLRSHGRVQYACFCAACACTRSSVLLIHIHWRSFFACPPL
jgi:hypothetical protein